jgi:signal transduction histidine kinase
MTPRRRWGTVRARTTAIAASVVAVALVVAAVGLVWLIRDRLVAADRVSAALRANDVLALARTGGLPGRLSYPGEETGATQVVNARGEVVAATSNIEGEGPISSQRPPAGMSSSEIRSLPIGDAQRFVVVAASDTVAGSRVTVLAAASLERTDQTVAAIAIALALGLPVIVLTVAATTRLLVGRALRPVASITNEVADISQFDLHRRVPEPGTTDEIDHLAVTMNEMLSRLESSSERQRRFTADASHELRSPLASARAVLEVAAVHPGSRAELIAAIEDALLDHARLDRLVLDLLTLARLQDGQSAVTATSVDLVKLARDVAVRRNDSHIEVVSDEESRVNAEPLLLERLLTNLLDNADRHRTSRTVITVRAGEHAGRLSIDDDGPGIAPHDRTRVFEPFTRLDEARPADEGSGLGLAIVRDITTALGGTVTVDDSPLGGARFVVTLPTADV